MTLNISSKSIFGKKARALSITAIYIAVIISYLAVFRSSIQPKMDFIVGPLTTVI